VNAQSKQADPPALSNAEIADRLAGLAQILSTQKENPFKVRAYRRAAARIRTFAESLDQMVRNEADLTRFAGIGEGISSAIREIVLTGTLGKLEKLRGQVSPGVADLTAYPRLDPKRVMRIYKKLGIASVEELKTQLENGAIEQAFGSRLAQHVRQGVTETHGMLLYHADDLRANIEAFLLGPCGARRAEAAGDYRRRVEVIDELVFLVDTDDFAGLVERVQRYGGRAARGRTAGHSAVRTLVGHPTSPATRDHEELGISHGRLHRIEDTSPQARGRYRTSAPIEDQFLRYRNRALSQVQIVIYPARAARRPRRSPAGADRRTPASSHARRFPGRSARAHRRQ